MKERWLSDMYQESLKSVHSLINSGFPRYLVEWEFSEMLKVIHKETQDKVREWLLADKSSWLYLYGDFGEGKSALAIGLAKLFYDKRKNFICNNGNSSLLYHNCSVMFDWLRDFNKNSESKIEKWEEILNSSFLVLDDFLTQKDTWYVFTKLYQLLDYRYANNYLTVITSNYSVDDCHDRILSFQGEDKDETTKMAERIVRRLSDRSFPVEVIKNKP